MPCHPLGKRTKDLRLNISTVLSFNSDDHKHQVEVLSTYRLIICSKIKAGMIVIVTTVSDVDSMSAI